MSVIMVPEGWEVKALHKISKTFAGGTPDRGIELYYNGSIPWVKSGEVNQNRIYDTEEKITEEALNNSSAKLIKKDTILVAMYGATAGQIAHLEIDACSNQAVLAVPINSDCNNFVFYALSYAMPKLLFQAQGSGQPNLSKQLVDKTLLVMPSLPEQQKIATILSTLDRTIEATQTLIDKEKMVKKGLMADLLTHGIDEKGCIRSPQTHTYVDSPLGMIPEGWNTTTLGDTAIFNAGYAFKNHELSEYGLKVVRISNLHKSSFPYWHYDGKIKKTWIVDKGDLLFSWAGVANSIDCVKYEGELALLNQHIFNLKIKDQVLKEFTFQYLQFHLPRLREEIEGGAGQLHLTKSKIESICIPDMKLLEKKKIVELFTAQDRKIETEETSLAKLQNLKKGLMGDLLSGKVRVKG